MCLRHVSREIAIEKSAWFHLANNCCMSILYNLRRIDEVCLEHVDNNFLPLPQRLRGDFDEIRSRTRILFNDTLDVLDTGAIDTVPMLRHRCDELKDNISATVHTLHDNLRDGDPGTMSVLYVYLNTLQETQELISSLRKFLRATAKLHTPQI